MNICNEFLVKAAYLAQKLSAILVEKV